MLDTVIIPTLQMRKLHPRKAKSLAQSPTAVKHTACRARPLHLSSLGYTASSRRGLSVCCGYEVGDLPHHLACASLTLSPTMVLRHLFPLSSFRLSPREALSFLTRSRAKLN